MHSLPAHFREVEFLYLLQLIRCKKESKIELKKIHVQSDLQKISLELIPQILTLQRSLQINQPKGLITFSKK